MFLPLTQMPVTTLFCNILHTCTWNSLLVSITSLLSLKLFKKTVLTYFQLLGAFLNYSSNILLLFMYHLLLCIICFYAQIIIQKVLNSRVPCHPNSSQWHLAVMNDSLSSVSNNQLTRSTKGSLAARQRHSLYFNVFGVGLQ